MKKFIKFIMQKGSNITVDDEMAQKILGSDLQVIKINDEKGNWTGRVINKAYIVSTERDYDAETDWRKENVKKIPPPLENPILTETQKKIIKDGYKKIKTF